MVLHIVYGCEYVCFGLQGGGETKGAGEAAEGAGEAGEREKRARSCRDEKEGESLIRLQSGTVCVVSGVAGTKSSVLF